MQKENDNSRKHVFLDKAEDANAPTRVATHRSRDKSFYVVGVDDMLVKKKIGFAARQYMISLQI